MEDLAERLTGGHPTAVKLVLASVVTGLAVYQVLLMAVSYRKVHLPFLFPRSASAAHRAVGDAIVVLVVVVGALCLAVFGVEDSVAEGAPGPDDRAGWHSAASIALVGVLGLKLAVLHRWRSLGRFLPLLGVSVLTLFVLTWLTSAGAFLLGGG